MINLRSVYRSLNPIVILGVLLLAAAGAEAQTRNYLIVTAPDYHGSAALNTFIQHKQGMELNVSTYVVPSGTTNTAIRAYIRSLWSGATAPGFVLLVGDTDGSTSTAATIPHFTGGGSKSAPTDLPYGCMGTDDDWQSEFPVGRFSVRNTTQLQAVTEKTIFLENGVFSDPDYVRRAAFLATDDGGALAEQTHEWVIDRYLTPAQYQPIRIYAAQGGGTADITAAVNNGCLWVNYFGHSSSSGWWSPSFNQSNVNALSNNGLYGLAFGFSCNTANFPTAECFGETWIRAPQKGSAAYLSASTFIYYGGDEWESSRRLEKHFWQSTFDDGFWEVGPAWRKALSYLCADSAFSLDVKRNMCEMFVLLGDPSLKLPQFSPGPDPVVHVRSPNGGEAWRIGEQYEIRWSAFDDVEVTSVDLFLSTDSGATFPVTITSGLPNSGSYSWTAPSYYTDQCRVKVVAFDADGNAGEDVSDADFEITPYGPRVIYDFPMNSDPGWSPQGLWAFGVPTGGGGSHGSPDPTSGHSGSYVYGYNLAGDYESSMPERYLTTQALNLAGYSDTKLTFWRWLGVEQPSYDHAKVQVSTNGTSWTTVWENTAQFEDGAWTYQEIDISAVADDKPFVVIRWVMGTTDYAWEFCGWNIDDVQITGVPPLLPGDLNCDGMLDVNDIVPFALALTDPPGYAATYPVCSEFLADLNADGLRDGQDVAALVALLVGS